MQSIVTQGVYVRGGQEVMSVPLPFRLENICFVIKIVTYIISNIFEEKVMASVKKKSYLVQF